MIIKGIILLVLVIGAFAFLGIKVAESIPQKELKLFFFGLYAITIITVFNVIISIYFFVKLSDKRGPSGRRGLRGLPGDSGEHGSCDTSCKVKTVELLLKTAVEKALESSSLNRGLNDVEKNIICSFIVNNKAHIENISDIRVISQLKDNIDTQINNYNPSNYIDIPLVANRLPQIKDSGGDPKDHPLIDNLNGIHLLPVTLIGTNYKACGSS